ncbi:MAG: D-amino acid aminotransferase [Gammaproteobacteria bacterium]|nr:D-amino acid aminotransferase [Gammaproteobacteria bacterium]MBU1645656.1 D-amino acid aminotransferase [Gammaproteobacteria bacterium]MBU1973542.1 D-amino acid aminotransferase [Gammaproteobacteria bacterium]
MSSVYLNGEFMPLAEARVPVMDRGFLFGDGVYEVIPVYSRRPFRLTEHLRRLHASLAAIRLEPPHGEAEWGAIVERIVAAADFADQSVYLQVTRGPMAVRNHAIPNVVTPTVFVMTEPLVTPPAELREQGIAAVSAADNRWLRCDIKATSLLANCLLRSRAVDHGCAETVLFRDGFLIEGAASNIFAVKDGVLLAPIKNHLMLPGITYDVVLELAARHGLPVQVRDVLEDEARNADELWMTSSTKEVLPIVMLDDKKVGAGGTAGQPGPVFAQMYGWYQDFKQSVMRGS